MLPNKSIMFWLVYTRPQNVIIRSFQLLLTVFLDCEFFVPYFMTYFWLSFWTVSFLYCILWFTVDCHSGLWVVFNIWNYLLLIVFLDCEFFVLYLMIYCWLFFRVVSFWSCLSCFYLIILFLVLQFIKAINNELDKLLIFFLFHISIDKNINKT